MHEVPRSCTRVALATGAYGTGMVVATAALIAAIDNRQEQWQGRAGEPSQAEVVMQAAQERSQVSPKAALWAGDESSERRGL